MALREQFNTISHAHEFTVAGVPWMTSSFLSSVVQHSFGKITQSVLVSNPSSGSIVFAITQNGLSSGNYHTLKPGASMAFDARISDLFLSGSAQQEYEVFAVLSEINTQNVQTITGSNSYDGVG